MNNTVLKAGRVFFRTYAPGPPPRILAVGPRDVNERLRSQAPPGSSYTGFDIEPGKGLRTSQAGTSTASTADTFDLCVAVLDLQRDPTFWATFTRLAEQVRAEGFICITVPGGCIHDDARQESWRLLPGAGPALAAWASAQGHPMALIESGILHHDGGQGDFVAVFQKHQVPSPPAAYMLDAFPQARQVRRLGDPAPRNPAGSGEDTEREATADAAVARERQRAEDAAIRADHAGDLARTAVARIRELEARVAAFESSLSWRITHPLRLVSAALPARLRPFLRGIVRAAGAPLPKLRDERPVALLIDDAFPRPDRDAGSVEIVNLAGALSSLGFRVLFGADREHADANAPGRRAIKAIGGHDLGSGDAPTLSDVIRRDGGTLSLVVLNRLYCGGRFMEDVRLFCPDARVVFNTLDLHYVRLRREAELTGNREGLRAADAARERELALARAADITVVVSSTERDVLLASLPAARVLVLPLARAARPGAASFQQRSGIGFIGGFAHAPNLDAVRYFLKEVWPFVLRTEPGIVFSIVGEGLPDEVLKDVPGDIRYLGPLAETDTWFGTLRLTVAPLRYGAGVKGKVVSSLAAGVPCVTTPIGAEGMEGVEGQGVLVADTAAGLAEALLRLHADPAGWAAQSAAGLAYIEQHHSPAAWNAALATALRAIGAMPQGAGIERTSPNLPGTLSPAL